MSKAQNLETPRVVPLNSSMRDVSRVPAEISKRMHAIIAEVGKRKLFKRFAVESHPALELMIAGRVPPTWAQWQCFQVIEREARNAATGQTNKRRQPFMPRVIDAATGELIAAPATSKQNARRQKARAYAAARTEREAERLDQLRDLDAQRKQRETCPCCKGQLSTKKLPANVVRLTFAERRASNEPNRAA